MKVKSTVVIEITSKEMYFATGVVEAEFLRVGVPPVVTSGQDSHESRPFSLHHKGRALDYRTKTIPLVKKIVLVNTIKTVLTPRGFFVQLESEGKDNEHMHIEFDPKENQHIFQKEV